MKNPINTVQKLVGNDQVKGGEIISRILASEGVENVFGIIDGTYFGLYSTFGDNGIRLITPRHESSAVHAAAAFARLSGKLGVCIASNGPGVANALPGVAVEQAEGNRVLLITSARRTGIIYPDRGGTFQYFPQTQVIAAMAKASFTVPSVDRIAELTRAALRECFSGRPGVVHLEMPEDLMNSSYPSQAGWFRPAGSYRATQSIPPLAEQVAATAALLVAAERPLIHAGSGVLHAGAFDELAELAEVLEAAVTTSWSARTAADERRPQTVPMPFVDAVKKARNEADCVLVLGSRLGETDWWGKAPYWAKAESQKLIQVDIDPATLGNNRPAEVLAQADVRAFMNALITLLRSHASTGNLSARRSWLDTLRAASAKRRSKLDKHLENKSVPMHPAHVATVCQQVFGDDAVMVIDGGNTAIWANFFHESRRPNTMLTTPKMGMLGAGCSQVLGAAVARPNAQIYAIVGDGAMGFHPQEVETAVRNDMPIIWLVLCDRQWGMVKINQQFALKPIKTLIKKRLSEEETINTDLGEIEFDAMARSMGAHGERVADPSGLENAIRRAVASGKPAVIHVDVDRTAHLWAPNLKDFKDMHGEPAG